MADTGAAEMLIDSQTLLSIVAALVVLFVFIWMLIPSANASKTDAQGNELIDPDDARQLGTLLGMYGMDAVDVAVVRFAVERFKKQYGRPPTTLDIGIIVGLRQDGE